MKSAIPYEIIHETVGGSQMFDLMMAVVKAPLLEKSRGYRDENINTPLEYVVAFFGDSANGETGERAEWRQSVGLQIQVELRGRKRPPILSVVDRLCIRAVELTQSLYFDMVIYAVFGMKSNQLPTGLISQPQNGEEKANAWGNLMQQLLGNPEKWKLDDLAANKIYQTPDGRPFRLRFDLSGNQFRYDFVPL